MLDQPIRFVADEKARDAFYQKHPEFSGYVFTRKGQRVMAAIAIIAALVGLMILGEIAISSADRSKLLSGPQVEGILSLSK